MKKIFLSLFIVLAIQNLSYSQEKPHSSPEGMQFFEGSWEEALLLAQKENKPIFLDVYAVWCGPCKALQRNTFPDASVGEYFNTNFINVSLDGEKGDGITVAQELNVQAYPSLFILNSSGNPVAYYPGYLRPLEFLEFGKTGLAQIK